MAKGKSSSKPSAAVKLAQQAPISKKQWAVFGVMSVIIAATPVALYTSPTFQLDLAEHAPQFVLFSLGAAALLVQAQKFVFAKYHNRVFNTRKVVVEGNQDVMEAEQQMRAAIGKESTAHTIFAVNTAYLLGVIVMGYMILPKLGVEVPSSVNHMIASIVPAMLLFVIGKQLH